MEKLNYSKTIKILVFLCLLLNFGTLVRGHDCDTSGVTDIMEPSGSQDNYYYRGFSCKNLLVKINWDSNTSSVTGYIMGDSQLAYFKVFGTVPNYVNGDTDGYLEFYITGGNALVFINTNPSFYAQVNYSIAYEITFLTFFNQFWYLFIIIPASIVVLIYVIRKSKRSKLHTLISEDQEEIKTLSKKESENNPS